jgi:hypothetical protein
MASKEMISHANVPPTKKKISNHACNRHHKPKTSSSGQNEHLR